MSTAKENCRKPYFEAILLSVLLGLAGCSKNADKDAAPVKAVALPTPEWLRGEILLMRDESPDNDFLLLRVLHMQEWDAWNSQSGVLANSAKLKSQVYQFNPGTRRIYRVPNEVWEAATGDILTAPRVQEDSPCVFKLDYDMLTLAAAGKPVATHGRSALRAASAPDGQSIAVMSSSGKRKEGFIPFMTGVSAPGTKYHEVLACPKPDRLVGPIELPFREREAGSGPIWSPDGKWVLYPDQYYQFIVIVPGTSETEAGK